MILKLLLLGFGSDRGFTGCYSSTWKPPPERCEGSYSNPFHRHGGATRVDDSIDFGPTTATASRLVTTYSTLVYEKGIAETNWNLSFANDLRFNDVPVEGFSLHQQMPFGVEWRGTADVPSGGTVRIEYAGGGNVRIGARTVRLPVSNQPQTVVTQVPEGSQDLWVEFRTGRYAPFAEIRILDGSGQPLAAAHPSLLERLSAALVWGVLAALLAVMAMLVLLALRADLAILAGATVAAIGCALISGPSDFGGFQYLAALLVPLLVWRRAQRPLLLAYGAVVAISAASVLNAVPDLHAVLYRASGTDFLTYESLARDVALRQFIDGGESVFFYQPGSRYVLAFGHLLFGDGDGLVTLWTLVALSMSFLALIVWNVQRVNSRAALGGIALAGFLLVAVLYSPAVVSLVAMAASEVPSWILLPLAIAAPQLRPRPPWAWIASAAAAALMWLMRNNQALAVLTILAATAAALGIRQRRLLVAAGVVVITIALLPAIHNLVFGQRLVFTTTSIGHVQQIDLLDLPQAFSSSPVGEEIRGHLGAIFYAPPTPGLTQTSLGVLLWGLLAIWVGATAAVLVRLRRHGWSLTGCLLLLVPIAYLAPHLIYQVEVYFPRHIIAGYLSMGAVGIGVFAELGRRQVR
jgi:hypothetical protein